MRLTKYRKIILTLLMMSFVGHAVASVTMPCQNMSSQSELQELMMNSAYMDYSQNMSMASADPNSPECNADCDCSLGGCITAVVPVSQQVFVANLTLLTNDHVTLAAKQLANSLYRPPISH